MVNLYLGGEDMIKRIFGHFFSETPTKTFNQKFYNEDQPLKLHIGCGTQYKPSWINIDNNSDTNIETLDIDWDLRKGMPFEDQSVDYIYHEHFIEHLSYEEGLIFMSDCYRVLKFGGVMRIACPDLDALVKCYIEGTWHEQSWVKKYQCEWMPSSAYMLNACMNENPWGHKYVYNKEDLKRRLCDAGYTLENISEASLNESEYELLQGLDNREDSMFFDALKS